MSSIPTVDAVRDEKIETVPNGSYGFDLEQKYNNAGSKDFTSRVVIAKKETKRKDDGLLETVCGWVVDHQIGI